MTTDKLTETSPRYATNRIEAIVADTPVLGIIGPCQSGKTMLANPLIPVMLHRHLIFGHGVKAEPDMVH
ncbi:MAG: hypothetical protein ACKVOJ_03105 [Sphingomonadaceae bacterium]